MKRHLLITTLLISSILALSGCGGESDETPETPAAETTAPSVTETPEAPQPPVEAPSAPIKHETAVTTISGETIGIKVTTEGFLFNGYEGRPVVLEFYGDTCPHCLNAIPTYNTLQQKYGEQILILTINDGGQYTTLDNRGLQKFAADHGIGYRTVSREKSGNLKKYAEGFVGKMNGVPYVIVMNREGVITTHMFVPSKAQLEAAIADVL